MMKNVFGVSRLNAYIKNLFAQDFVLNQIYVKGEVSNCKYHSSGHIYFTLKDEGGAIAAVMFAGARKGLAFRMEEGQNVVVLGNVDVYERDGRYQLYAKEIILDGAGLLYQRFEQLKQELEEMGMFSNEYKQPIPKYIKKLGVVTASTGAAIRDIINVAGRRNPYVQVILYSAQVQGEKAVASIVKGIETLEEYGVDTIIVGRGGGSIEDLWAFNEEAVAHAIFHCKTPVISAVGHETDTTIADFVADLRAPTPSAAAELAVYDYRELESQINWYQQALKTRLRTKLEHKRNLIESYQLKLNYLSPKNQIQEKRFYSVEIERKLQELMKFKLEQKHHQLALYMQRMEGLSPIQKLNQGYSYVSNEKGKSITSVKEVKQLDELKICVTDGVIHVKVTDTQEIRR